jgi:hypothetical protein
MASSDHDLTRTAANGASGWLHDVCRVGDILYKGTLQEVSRKDFEEFTCEVPADQQVRSTAILG